MFESSLPIPHTDGARQTDMVDGAFHELFKGMPSRFDPGRK